MFASSAAARRLFPAFLALLLAPALWAQPSAPGAIEGRVQLARSGEYLEGVRLTVEGTNLEAATDATGQYRLGGVPAGPARLRAFYTGLAPIVENVSVPPGGTVQRDLTFGPAAGAPAAAAGAPVRLDAFVVGKDQPYKPEVGNRQLLWHGSRLTNWVGIFSQGLRIAPPEAPCTGYMSVVCYVVVFRLTHCRFGKGVYFADMV